MMVCHIREKVTADFGQQISTRPLSTSSETRMDQNFVNGALRNMKYASTLIYIPINKAHVKDMKNEK